MSNPNRPYVLELASMVYRAERDGATEEAAKIRAAAAGNGVTEVELRKAIGVVAALPDSSDVALGEWVRQRYLADGREKGYVGEGAEPTVWVLGQLARAHYAGELQQ